MFAARIFQLATTTLLMSAALAAQAATPVDLQILSATVKDQKIAGANVILQRNGEQAISAVTDVQGQATLNASFVDDASSLLIIKKPGFSNLVVKCPCAGMTYAISPVMRNLDGLRIVLNWGASPSDLDSHLVYPGNHVYFSQKEGSDANLDVDDTDSYGPETITIERKHSGERYVYAVHNFSHRQDIQDSSLSNSNAKVFVYVGQTLIKTYYVPKNQLGNLWTVFAVNEQGEIQDYNTLQDVASEDHLQTAEFQGVIDRSQVRVENYGQDALNAAKQLNSEGETAYHAGNLDNAIALYQQAIELDGNYGQAYSNLGLAFQKAGRVAEAMWANRKAIALASGNTAATVRASSHYNNARIYEAAQQWSDALREFRAAKAEKANPAYDKGIKRMQQKGAQ